jgi:hypothetical protein
VRNSILNRTGYNFGYRDSNADPLGIENEEISTRSDRSCCDDSFGLGG